MVRAHVTFGVGSVLKTTLEVLSNALELARLEPQRSEAERTYEMRCLGE